MDLAECSPQMTMVPWAEKITKLVNRSLIDFADKPSHK